jgi:hypothetical protein
MLLVEYQSRTKTESIRILTRLPNSRELSSHKSNFSSNATRIKSNSKARIDSEQIAPQIDASNYSNCASKKADYQVKEAP